MIDTFAKNGCPVRHIHVEKLDEATLGELLMHFMLETVLTGYAMGIDPFDQPAVEEAKVLAKRYLTEGRVPRAKAPRRGDSQRASGTRPSRR
jgi:glucose-6-phosphate isomerase